MKARNNIKSINAQQIRNKEVLNASLDALHGNIQDILQNEAIAQYQELNNTLQELQRMIENLDTY